MNPEPDSGCGRSEPPSDPAGHLFEADGRVLKVFRPLISGWAAAGTVCGLLIINSLDLLVTVCMAGAGWGQGLIADITGPKCCGLLEIIGTEMLFSGLLAVMAALLLHGSGGRSGEGMFVAFLSLGTAVMALPTVCVILLCF